jgi:opacity protein-like surface antigen
MKASFFPAFLTSMCLAQVAVAGGPIAVADDPAPAAMPAPAAATDWSGFYGGLSFGKSSGDQELTGVPGSAPLDRGTVTALYFGYLRQNNTLVYGAEIAVNRLEGANLLGFDCCEVDKGTDVKARVGVAANRALVYGVLGYTFGSFTQGPDNWKPEGPSYGIGVDYLATERVMIGMEYLTRDMTGDNPSGASQQNFIDLETLSLRVGFKF